MKKVFASMAVVAAAALPAAPAHANTLAAGGRSAVYGGGPFYSGGQSVMNTLRASGFTTVVLWAIHVHADTGDLYLNDQLVVSNGQYVGNADWPAQLRTLKQAPTSVNRIEVSVGSAGPDDWGAIASLISQGGTGTSSILYRNFQALRSATGADAINDDDEQHYDLNSTTSFARMVISQGYTFTLVPYTNMGFWRSVKSNLGASVDRVYLQDYAGGTGNDPGAWASSLGMPVDPGLWSKHGSGCATGDSPTDVGNKMRAWKASAGIPGGFMWLYDDIQACAGQYPASAYAAAINNATGGGSTPPPVPAGQNVALNRPATGSASCNSAESPAKAVNGSLSGGTTDKWCSLAATKTLTVDLGSSRSLNGFVVRHAGAGGESATWDTRDYDIQVSTDNATWKTVVQARANTADVAVHNAATSGRYVRLNVITAEQGGNSAARIYEFEAYAS
ncbi:discoidin domain-containing protein [Actinoplanes sp. NPDC051343]|uniref:discoidin domain-containing protein n=1 Tax=Actinoplanes sp. NPDC051343 TaxID=3363906 RepID=UPI0037B2AF43